MQQQALHLHPYRAPPLAWQVFTGASAAALVICTAAVFCQTARLGQPIWGVVHPDAQGRLVTTITDYGLWFPPLKVTFRLIAFVSGSVVAAWLTLFVSQWARSRALLCRSPAAA
jgi:hypothetical protein